MFIQVEPYLSNLSHFASLFNSLLLIGLLILIELTRPEEKKARSLGLLYPVVILLVLLLVYFQIAKFISL